jgi:hypothetical protein
MPKVRLQALSQQPSVTVETVLVIHKPQRVYPRNRTCAFASVPMRTMVKTSQSQPQIQCVIFQILGWYRSKPVQTETETETKTELEMEMEMETELATTATTTLRLQTEMVLETTIKIALRIPPTQPRLSQPQAMGMVMNLEITKTV